MMGRPLLCLSLRTWRCTLAASFPAVRSATSSMTRTSGCACCASTERTRPLCEATPESPSMSAAHVGKNASRPFWIAWYAKALARCVLPIPGLSERMRLRPSLTSSGERNELITCSRSIDRNVTVSPSTPVMNGACVFLVSRATRVFERCVFSSAARAVRIRSEDQRSTSARRQRSRHKRLELARCRRLTRGSSSSPTSPREGLGVGRRTLGCRHFVVVVPEHSRVAGAPPVSPHPRRGSIGVR